MVLVLDERSYRRGRIRTGLRHRCHIGDRHHMAFHSSLSLSSYNNRRKSNTFAPTQLKQQQLTAKWQLNISCTDSSLSPGRTNGQHSLLWRVRDIATTGDGVVIAWAMLITISAFGLIRIKVRLPTVVQIDVKAYIEFRSSSARGASYLSS
jgi:hypothetical protein